MDRFDRRMFDDLSGYAPVSTADYENLRITENIANLFWDWENLGELIFTFSGLGWEHRGRNDIISW